MHKFLLLCLSTTIIFGCSSTKKVANSSTEKPSPQLEKAAEAKNSMEPKSASNELQPEMMANDCELRIVKSTVNYYSSGIGGGRGELYQIAINNNCHEYMNIDSVFIDGYQTTYELKFAGETVGSLRKRAESLLLINQMKYDYERSKQEMKMSKDVDGNNVVTKQKQPKRIYDGFIMIKYSNTDRNGKLLLKKPDFKKVESPTKTH